MQIKSNWGYRYLITRRYAGGEYYDEITFIKKEQLPADALNIRNYGKYWFYFEENITPDPAPQGPQIMRASDICTWADNNDVNRALSAMWGWTNNLDLKKILFVVAVAFVGITLFMMIR